MLAWLALGLATTVRAESPPDPPLAEPVSLTFPLEVDARHLRAGSRLPAPGLAHVRMRTINFELHNTDRRSHVLGLVRRQGRRRLSLSSMLGGPFRSDPSSTYSSSPVRLGPGDYEIYDVEAPGHRVSFHIDALPQTRSTRGRLYANTSLQLARWKAPLSSGSPPTTVELFEPDGSSSPATWMAIRVTPKQRSFLPNQTQLRHGKAWLVVNEWARVRGGTLYGIENGTTLIYLPDTR